MTYAPPTLTDLGHYWEGQGGVNLGIVGDASHKAKGTSYHLGEGDLIAGAYSAQSPRDRAGLSEAASAIDLGRLDGSLGQLRLFTVWLVDQARHNAAGTGDMREIIYSPNGVTVMRWDRERGYSSQPRSGEADDSHLTHTHVSWYRDAQHRDHSTAFRPYFTLEDPVHTADLTYWQTANVKGGRLVRDRAGARIHTTPDVPGRYPLVGVDTDDYVIRLPDDVVGWIAKTDVGSISRPGPQGHDIPPSADCAEAIRADRLKARITYGA